MIENDQSPCAFAALGLPDALLAAIKKIGYETPSPIQAEAIPLLLEGRDVLGQAQTGTGKTAAFALPILARLDPDQHAPQALVLAPTRELAIQVAEAFQSYASDLRKFHVLPIYGGQSYGPQLAGLKRGVQVIVGTPGRVIDHLKKGTLKLGSLRFLVLDEGDEMLRMGFIGDVETVLEATPDSCQIALFSATMPTQIRRIAKKYLNDPAEIIIKNKTSTAANIHQYYWLVSGLHKLDAMTRILEAEPFDAMLVFTRTKKSTEELAEKLRARGFAAGAINGDIAQAQRERTIAQLKSGKIDILVATDVAARGLDVDRISHVLNYDIPYDTESYVHRIGRTGRAGREGQAILFVSPRERGMLRAIENATRQPIEVMQLPSIETVNNHRVAQFKQRISDTLAGNGLEAFQNLVREYEHEHDIPAVEMAAALASMAQGDQPLLLSEPKRPPPRARQETGQHTRQDKGAYPRRERAPDAHKERSERTPGVRKERSERTPGAYKERNERAPGAYKERSERTPDAYKEAGDSKPSRDSSPHVTEQGKETFRLEVGHQHGVKPTNIVGAIANEAGLDSQFIGRISIRDDHSLIDLPEGMPKEVLHHLQTVWVSGQTLRIHREGEKPPKAAPRRADKRAPAKPRKPRKP